MGTLLPSCFLSLYLSRHMCSFARILYRRFSYADLYCSKQLKFNIRSAFEQRTRIEKELAESLKGRFEKRPNRVRVAFRSLQILSPPSACGARGHFKQSQKNQEAEGQTARR